VPDWIVPDWAVPDWIAPAGIAPGVIVPARIVPLGIVPLEIVTLSGAGASRPPGGGSKWSLALDGMCRIPWSPRTIFGTENRVKGK
jgi:hypothetical protein